MMRCLRRLIGGLGGRSEINLPVVSYVRHGKLASFPSSGLVIQSDTLVCSLSRALSQHFGTIFYVSQGWLTSPTRLPFQTRSVCLLFVGKATLWCFGELKLLLKSQATLFSLRVSSLPLGCVKIVLGGKRESGIGLRSERGR